MDTWISRMRRRAYIRQLVAWAGVAVLGVVLVAANSRYVANFVQGPFVTAPADLARISNPSDAARYFVRLTGTRAIETGIREITVRRRNGREVGRSVAAEFYALEVGGRFLLVKSRSGRPLSVEGSLSTVPAEVDRDMFGGADGASLRPRFYPFYLDASPFRFGGYAALCAWAVFLALAAWKAWPAWRRLNDLSRDPLIERVASWGGLTAVSASVEKELNGPDVVKRGPWKSNWTN